MVRSNCHAEHSSHPVKTGIAQGNRLCCTVDRDCRKADHEAAQRQVRIQAQEDSNHCRALAAYSTRLELPELSSANA